MNLGSDNGPLTPSLSPRGRGRRPAGTSIGFRGSMRDLSGKSLPVWRGEGEAATGRAAARPYRVHGPNACEESNFDATCRVEGSGDVSPHTKTPTLHCGWIIGRCLIEHSNLPSAGLPGSWSPRSPGRFPG